MKDQQLVDQYQLNIEHWAEVEADTAKTYATRVRTTIQEYMKWSAAPHEYDPKKSVQPKREEVPKEPKPQAQAAPEPIDPSPVAQPKPDTVPVERMDRIRLGGGRDLFYLAPKDGLFMKDALRAAYALIVACEDYDPSQTPMQVMAHALNGGGQSAG
jgi:hypothetical protein